MATPPNSGLNSNSFNYNIAKQVNHTDLLQKDPKFVKYTYIIERTLAGFESVNEWADVSAFLSRLLKCIDAYPQFKVIPHKLILAKRLAQCLNPALPTGVHQKTLSVYVCVFEKIGADALTQDLAIYSYADFLTILYKPQLLSLYENHIMSLGLHLRPCTKSLLIGILPGLEEEGNEYFEKVLFLVDLLYKNVGPTLFFQSIWLILITSPKSRIPAINFLSRRFPSITTPEDVALILGEDCGLMIQAFAVSLKDKDLLIKRGILDLLVKFLPLKNRIFEGIHYVHIIESVLGVFHSRDMSLNRRIYSLLLGDSELNESTNDYFNDYGKSLTIEALKIMLSNPSKSIDIFRNSIDILIALMDKSELGLPILQTSFSTIFIEIIKQYKNYSEFTNEFISIIGNFLDNVDPAFIWTYLYKLVSSIETLNLEEHAYIIRDEIVEYIHIPCFLTHTLLYIEEFSEKASNLNKEMVELVSIASLALSKIPRNIFNEDEYGLNGKPLFDASASLELMQSYYKQEQADDQETQVKTLNNMSMHIKGPAYFKFLIQKTQQSMINIINIFISDKDVVDVDAVELFQQSCLLLKQLTSFPLTVEFSQQEQELWTTSLLGCCRNTRSFKVIDSAIMTLIDLTAKGVISSLTFLNTSVLAILLDRLWLHLNPKHGANYVRSIDLIWLVGQVFPISAIESYFSRKITNSTFSDHADDLEYFGWFFRISTESGRDPAKHFARPLFNIIDALSDENVDVKQRSQAWIRKFLVSYPEILNVLINVLLDKELRRNLMYRELINPNHPLSDIIYPYELVDGVKRSYVATYETVPDLLQIDYAFTTLLNLSRSEGLAFIQVLQRTTLTEGEFILNNENISESSYLTFFIQIIISFLLTEVTSTYGPSKCQQNLKMYCTIGQLLQHWLPFLTKSKSVVESYIPLLSELLAILGLRINQWILDERLGPQVEFLPVLLLLSKIPTLEFSVVAEPPFKRKLEFCIEHGFYPLTFRLDSAAYNANEMVASTYYLSVLTLAAVTEPKAERVLQYWYEAFILTLPYLTTVPLFEVVVEPILDGSLKLIAVTDFQSPDRSTLVAFVNQIYSTLCSGLGIHKWTNFSTLAKKESSMFDRIAFILPSQEQLPPNKDLAKTLALRIPILLETLARLWSFYNRIPNTDKTNLIVKGTFFSSRAQAEIIKLYENLASLFHKDFSHSFAFAWLKLTMPIHEDSSVSETYSLDLFKILARTPSFSVTSSFHEWLQLAKKKVTDTASGHRSARRKNAMYFNLTDLSTIKFLEIFLSQLPTTTEHLLASTWPIFITFLRETLYSINNQKYLYYPLLRIYEYFCIHAGFSEDIQDKKLKKEGQEIYQKLIDNVVSITSKPLDQSSWLKIPTSRGVEDDLLLADIDYSKFNSPTPTSPATFSQTKVSNEMIHLYQVMHFIKSFTLVQLNRHFPDQEKATLLLTNLVYYFIGPCLKQPNSCYKLGLEMLGIISQYNYAYRCWKREGWEAFMDPNFFQVSTTNLSLWIPLLRNILHNERDKLPDIIGRITVSPGSMFTSRDYEVQNRATMVRRLSFIIYCGTTDEHLIALPMIQEKLVELIKAGPNHLVRIELFLCLRVLLARFSTNYLASFWPVLLTELVQIFESCISKLQVAKSSSQPEQIQNYTPEEELNANFILAVCKFIDVLLLYQIEDFQIYQWIFINEVLGFVNYANSATYALIDRLSINPSTTFKPSEIQANQLLGKPTLNLRRIQTITELSTFFDNLSLTIFTNAYYHTKPDNEFIEKLLLVDFTIAFNENAVVHEKAVEELSSNLNLMELELDNEKELETLSQSSNPPSPHIDTFMFMP